MSSVATETVLSTVTQAQAISIEDLCTALNVPKGPERTALNRKIDTLVRSGDLARITLTNSKVWYTCHEAAAAFIRSRRCARWACHGAECTDG